MDRFELSQVNFGLLIDNRVPPTQYKPEWFAAPYDSGVEILQQRGKTKEDVAKTLSSAYINDAHEAVKRWNGIGDKENFDWAKALQKSYINSELSRPLAKAAKRLAENEDVDLLPIYGQISSIIASEASGLTQASTIDYTHYRPFMKSGNPVMDKILGGMPSDDPLS